MSDLPIRKPWGKERVSIEVQSWVSHWMFGSLAAKDEYLSSLSTTHLIFFNLAIKISFLQESALSLSFSCLTLENVSQLIQLLQEFNVKARIPRLYSAQVPYLLKDYCYWELLQDDRRYFWLHRHQPRHFSLTSPGLFSAFSVLILSSSTTPSFFPCSHDEVSSQDLREILWLLCWCFHPLSRHSSFQWTCLLPWKKTDIFSLFPSQLSSSSHFPFFSPYIHDKKACPLSGTALEIDFEHYAGKR